jgi:hypothetical protein
MLLGNSTLYGGMDNGSILLDNFSVSQPDEPLIPENISIRDDFAVGTGKVGRVQEIQGKVYVIHKGSIPYAYRDNKAYLLKPNHPIFEGDTLITGTRSRVNVTMDDKSSLAMAPQAKLVISKLKYKPMENSRATEIELVWGSARFIVKELSGESTYKVKTLTAVSDIKSKSADFAVSVAPVSENRKTSALGQFLSYLSYLSPIKEAHALVSGALITTVLTGPGSTVGLTGAIGGTTIVGPASVAGVLGGAAAGGATFVGATVATGVLGSVGPGLATLAMPPHLR